MCNGNVFRFPFHVSHLPSNVLHYAILSERFCERSISNKNIADSSSRLKNIGIQNSLSAFFLAEQIKKLCHTERMWSISENKYTLWDVSSDRLHRNQYSLLAFFFARQYLMETSCVLLLTSSVPWLSYWVNVFYERSISKIKF